MVRMGDFQIQLVQATTNVPFAEHYHNEQIYVEMPRGTEYFISVSKPQAKLYSGSIILRFYVDGKYLGFNLTYAATRTSLQPKYKGKHTRDGEGLSSDTALRFPVTSDNSSKNTKFAKVKVKIYPAVMAQDGRVRYDRKCLLSTMTVLVGSSHDLLQDNVLCSDDPIQESPLSAVKVPPNPLKEQQETSSLPPFLSSAPKMRWELLPDCQNPVQSTTSSNTDARLADNNDDDNDTTQMDPSETLDWGSFVFVEPDLAVIAMDDGEMIL